MKKYFLLFFIFFCQIISYASGNDECSNATQLIPSAACNSTAGTFNLMSLSGTAPSCAPNATQDVWYSFTATEQTMSINVTRTSTNWTMYFTLEIYENSCSGNRFRCVAPNANAAGYYNTDFIIGRTYYVRVVNASSEISTRGFDICVRAFPKPANDTCATAAVLTPGAMCVNTAGTFSGALLDGAIPSCAPNTTQDVWYRFTATEQTMSINVARTSANWTMYFALEIYEDSCSGNRFKCVVPNANAVGYYNTDFVIGRTYYVRVVNASSEINTLGFDICVRAFPKPANDTCATATVLTPGTACVNTAGTFSGALLDGAIPSCAPNTTQDVWYKFTATEQTMSINVTRSSANWTMYFALEIYEDSCSGNRFKCVVPNANAVGYYNTDFVIGRTYYVRVVNASSEINPLGFDICVRAFPKPANDTCATAAVLTPSATCVNTSGTFSGALLDGAIPSCAPNTTQDVWYRFTATEQTMSINVARSSANWTMYFALEIYEDSCSGNRFKCVVPNANAVGYYNTDFVIGRTYYVRLVNASSELNTLGFDICVRAFPKPANDTCATAVVLTPGTACVNTAGTFSGALLDGAIPSCAPNTTQDVWYRFTATGLTMAINVTRASANWTMFFALEIYEDSCTGNRFQCIIPNQNAVSYSGNNFVIGRTYYVRLVNASSELNTLGFNICLTGPPPVTCTPSVAISASTTSICQGQSVVFTATPTNGGTVPSYEWKVNGNTVGTNSSSFTTTTLTNGNSVTCTMVSNAPCASPANATSNAITIAVAAPTVPAFTQIAPICFGNTFSLPATSNNGISGSWSPAINTTATATYSFTPNAGQCASTATMTVVVNSANAAVTVQGNTITASATGATYQWINCANNQPINGATDVSFTASGNGSYAVIVNQNGCSATSNCVPITNLGTGTFVQNGWKLYPNPATHQLFVELKEATEIAIIDTTGRTIRHEALKSGKNVVDVSSLTSGVYFIKSVFGPSVKFVKK